MRQRIFFVTHSKSQCGVYEFGIDLYSELKKSQKYEFIKCEIDSLLSLKSAVKEVSPRAIIYNYHPSVLPWTCDKMDATLYRNNLSEFSVPQIGIIHEVTQDIANDAIQSFRTKYFPENRKTINSIFDYYIAHDPTLLMRNPFVFKSGRVITPYINTFLEPSIPTFTSFGLATPGKNFPKIVNLVQDEYDAARIHINIPAATFWNGTFEEMERVVEACHKSIYNHKIELRITHDYLSKEALRDFVAESTASIFLYEQASNRGISSVTDIALAAGRPIAISNSSMFRHLLAASPSICVERSSLRDIVENGVAPLEPYRKDWSGDNIRWDYETMLDKIIEKHPESEKIPLSLHSFNKKIEMSHWVTNEAQRYLDDPIVLETMEYVPIKKNNEIKYNTILDNRCRKLYLPTVNFLHNVLPKAMSKKIPEANVQQAFILNSVALLLQGSKDKKLLCIGSFSDTACLALQKMGYWVDEVDPAINYTLQEFITRPGTKPKSYDIIFSTSVIEHDPDDESFMGCVSELLAPGGVFFMTCDYLDGWKPGDPKPDVDARFYTRDDLENRLPSYLEDCQFLDEPDWHAGKPDFSWSGFFYSFASFAVRKNSKA